MYKNTALEALVKADIKYFEFSGKAQDPDLSALYTIMALLTSLP